MQASHFREPHSGRNALNKVLYTDTYTANTLFNSLARMQSPKPLGTGSPWHNQAFKSSYRPADVSRLKTNELGREAMSPLSDSSEALK